jgi:hypothetical protein
MTAHEKQMTRLKIPTSFWADHFDRKPCDGNPALEIATPVAVCGTRTLIEATPAQLATLRADAEFYSDAKHWDDPAHRWLVRGAGGTLRAITKAGA